MKIVIDIPEAVYDQICREKLDGIMARAIRCGRPLPKGHGRLIDADALRQTMYHEAFETDSPMQKWDGGCWIRYKMFERAEDAAPTIIPASEERVMSIGSVKYGDICDKCAHVEYCDMATFGGHNPRITACSHFSQSKQTNADRIRAMTDEELAEWVSDMHNTLTCPNGGAISCNPSCKRCWLDWLKKEVEK